MTEQGYPPRRPGEQGRSGWSRIPQEPRRPGRQAPDAFDPGLEADDDLPPWAGPGVQPVRPARRQHAAVDVVEVIDDPPEPPQVSRLGRDAAPRRGQRPGRSRAAATRRRRAKRRLLTLASVIVVIAVVAAAVYYLRQPAATPSGGPITTLQKGEYSKIPDACRAVPATLLTGFVGTAPKLLRPQPGECTFTVDTRTTFRELTVQVQALQPNAGYGNGSATANAIYNFAQQRAHLARPPKHTPEPPAKITPIPGIGDEAFVAALVFHVGPGAITNKVIVLVRYKNVLITTFLQGDVHGGAASAQVGQLRAGALAAARVLLSAVKAEPAIG